MYKLIYGQCFFATEKNDIIYTEPFINDYVSYLTNSKNLAQKTIFSHVSVIYKYWIYSLFFSKEEDENLFNYLIRYKNALENGFKIEKDLYLKDFNTTKTLTLIKFKPTKQFCREFSTLEKYFLYIFNQDINPSDLTTEIPVYFYTNKKNFKKMLIRDKYSKGVSYGLKAKGLMKSALLENITIFKEFKKMKPRTNQYRNQYKKIFPFKYYDKLLSIADNRMKLFYILCGACSARKGQALQLTKYDIDFKNKKVYLIDSRYNFTPLDEQFKPLNNQKGRYDLLKEKDIDFYKGKYKLIASKYHIPTIDSNDNSLKFLFPKYRNYFFEIYLKYSKKIKSQYPFIFQTQSDDKHPILLPSNVSDFFKRDVKRMCEKYGIDYYGEHLDIMNLHSLRKMYGSVMADIAIFQQAHFSKNSNIMLPNKEIINVYELIKIWTAKAMGHSNLKSLDVYFNTTEVSDIFIEQIIFQNMENINQFFNQIILKGK